MAKVRCPGCWKIQSAKKLDGCEGFAECPECKAVFDVTPEVETHSRRDAGFWPQGGISEPSDVEVIVRGADTAQLQGGGGYRTKGRVQEDEASLLLTCTNQKLKPLRVVGPLLMLLLGAPVGFLFQLNPPGAQRVLTFVFILLGLPALYGFYLTLVGFLNRVSIRVDGSFLRVDQGPLPYPHEKVELRVANIQRLCAHSKMESVRGTSYHPVYEVWAWLPAGQRRLLVERLKRPATAIYIQRRLAAFLGVGSIGPVDLVKRDEKTGE